MMKCLLLYPGKNWKLAERLFFLIRCYCKSLLLKRVEIGDSPASLLSFSRAVDESIVHCWPVELQASSLASRAVGWADCAENHYPQTTLLPRSNCSRKLITVEWSSKVWRGTFWPKTSHSTPVGSLKGFHPCPRVACSAGVSKGEWMFLLAKAPGYYFYSPQSSSVIKSKMAAITIRTWTSFRPPKIRLDCRLVPGQHYIMSGHLSGADWKDILRSAHHCTVVGREVSPVRIASQTLDEERDCFDWRCQHPLARTLQWSPAV